MLIAEHERKEALSFMFKFLRNKRQKAVKYSEATQQRK